MQVIVPILCLILVWRMFESIIENPDSKSKKGEDSAPKPEHGRRAGDKPGSGDDKATLSLKDLESGLTIYISTKKPGGDKA
jgi:hypothetical protein